jgi:uncharacterized protein YbjQ (UPF0145 family)
MDSKTETTTTATQNQSVYTASKNAEGKTMSMDAAQPRTPYQVSAPRYSVSHQMVTTAFELPNYRVSQNLGVVRGIVVRSRNIFATIGAGLQTIVGGNITVWTKLCEQTRADAFDIMIQHASEIGANAVVGARYDTTELSAGVTEVLAYGTAVIVEPENPGESYRS